MKTAVLWDVIEKDGLVLCHACSHLCKIRPGGVGACNVRKNVNGKLYSLVYEHPVAMHIDPIEKKPLFHVKPGSKVLSFGTVGCNFKCAFCQNWDISQSKDVGREMMTPTQIVKLALEDGCEGIAYTYNEPIIFVEYVLETAKLAHEAGLINVYVSNGYETEEALQMLAPHIDAMNIDLKGFTDKFYLSLCKARLQPVLDTIRRAHELGIWIELTTLVIPGKNDSEKELQELSKFIVSVDPEIPWHISRFFPHYKIQDTPPTPIDTLIGAQQIGRRNGLNHVYVGNVPDEQNNTFCVQCGATLFRRTVYDTEALCQEGVCPQCGSKCKGIF